MHIRHPLILMITTIALASWISAGCSSQKYEKAEAASGELHAAAAELKADQANIDATLKELNNLANATSGDLRPKYKAYGAALDKLTASARRTEERADAMRARGEKYFAAWDAESAEIKDEDIRARSEARQANVKAQFARVSDLYQQTKAQAVPYASDLRDIRTALGTDLTPAGLESVRDIVKRATDEGRRLQETIGQLAAEFDKLGVKMSPKG